MFGLEYNETLPVIKIWKFKYILKGIFVFPVAIYTILSKDTVRSIIGA